MRVKWFLVYAVLLNVIVFAWNNIQLGKEGLIQMLPIIIENVELDVAPILLVSQVSVNQLEKAEKPTAD